MLAKDPSERPDAATDVFVALDVIDLAISGEVPAIPDDEAHSLDRLVGEPFVYVRNAERDSNDPADLSKPLAPRSDHHCGLGRGPLQEQR